MKKNYLIYFILINTQLIASQKADLLKDIPEMIRKGYPNLEKNPNQISLAHIIPLCLMQLSLMIYQRSKLYLL